MVCVQSMDKLPSDGIRVTRRDNMVSLTIGDIWLEFEPGDDSKAIALRAACADVLSLLDTITSEMKDETEIADTELVEAIG